MTASVRLTTSLMTLAMLIAMPSRAQAQAEEPPDEGPASALAAVQFDPDLRVDPVQPSFTLASLPTTLRMPDGKFAFRLSHRFSRPIAQGDAGDFFADLFGFDSSAKVGLEFRYGLRPGTQMTVYRINDRAIQVLGQHEIIQQDEMQPVTVHAVAAVEGANNFSEDFGLTLGAVLSHRIAARGLVYAQPLFVINANPLPGDETDNNHAVMLGLGIRLRLGESQVYVVAEAAPRLSGFDGGVDHVSFAVEKRYGGHVFQFSVSSNLGTTLRQLARGGPPTDDWFVGFNLTRRFF